MSLTDQCPRSGGVRLETKQGADFWLPTKCKTWSCPVCRTGLKAFIKARVIYGLTHSTGSLFITITYVMDGPASIQNAQSVASDLRSLWRILKQDSRWTNMSYVKVPELTQQGQVHLHVIATNVDYLTDSCRRRGEKMIEMNERACKVKCIQHQMMMAWSEVTNAKSFVVDASRVRDNHKSAAYVTKYVVKAFHQREELEALGFKRRYSISRGWPGVGRLRLAFSDDPGWHKVEMYPTPYIKVVAPEIQAHLMKGGDTLPRIGEDVTEIVFGNPETRRLKAALRKVYDGTATFQDSLQAESGSSRRGRSNRGDANTGRW